MLESDSSCNWVVCGGDDTLPDPNNHPDKIATECSAYFSGTLGVMQPTGDTWSDSMGRIIERIAGSPWIGRSFALRANSGNGPWYPDYWHMFGDEHLQCVASKLGIFWQRPDLVHYHDHWGRPRPGEHGADINRMPDFLKEANSSTEWVRAKDLFERQRADGFIEALGLLPA